MKLKNIFSGKKGMYPQKRNMNLYVRERTVNSPSTVIATAIALAVLITLFTRVGVVGRLDKVRELRSRVREQQIELERMQEELSDYDEVTEKYQRYTDRYLTDEEAGLVDRGEIISIVENNVMKVGKCPSITIRGNAVSLVIQVPSLDEVATIREKLEACENVSDVTVYTADWNENNVYVSYGESLEEEEPVSFVQASICFRAISEEEASK